MKKFIRYGTIPENERSIDFIAMSFEENEDFTWYMEDGAHETRMEALLSAVGHSQKRLEEILEAGTSVFDADDAGNIVLHNDEQRKTLEILKKENRPVYLVTGDVVGTGRDGEPLIRNIQIVKEIQ